MWVGKDGIVRALVLDLHLAYGRVASPQSSHSVSLPESAYVDRILRYETTIERQLYRAINQLERLQRERLGDLVPPPIAFA